MATEGRKVEYEELTEKQTFLIISVNYGLDYARKLYLSRYHGKTEATYVRELNRLNGIGWLNKNKGKDKNKKIYSVIWNKVTDSFVKHLIERFDSHLEEQKVWAKQNFRMQPNKSGEEFTKISKTKEEIKKEMGRIYELKRVLGCLKRSKREEKDLLIPYFQDHAFVLFYELDFHKQLSDLYDEIIYGIGKSLRDNLLGKNIKSEPFLNNIIYLCFILYSVEKEKFCNPLSNAFHRFFKDLNNNSK